MKYPKWMLWVLDYHCESVSFISIDIDQLPHEILKCVAKFRYWYFIRLCKLKHASYVTENFLHAIYTKLFKMYWYFRSNSFRCRIFIKCSFCASLLTSKCVVSILTKNVCVFTFEKVKWNIFSQWTILNHINSARGIFSNLAILHYG